ncbi:unnamed protein product [Oppiella nova]|uniref:DUF3888 domain-containing protein n=1 Tax=Oppiella nova TaxID=334625 RepID=A0A7R9LT43_9ACAR|nr:unnamed protein product [Oppiella nova]CAG2166114.1 unnamed protein product [Oppiella nova]
MIKMIYKGFVLLIISSTAFTARDDVHVIDSYISPEIEAHVIKKMMDFVDKPTNESLAELMVKELDTKYPDHIGWIGQFMVNATASQLYMSVEFESYIKLQYREYVLGIYRPKPVTLKQLLLLSD